MSWLNEGDREIYSGLADALLPEFGVMPSASSIDPAGKVLGDILTWRPDIAGDLRRAIDRSRTLPADSALDLLEREDKEALAALRVAVLGAYYLHPQVMAAIGYDGQRSRPLDEKEPLDFIDAGLLRPVMQRGPTWRDPSP
jgi:hypothetical protein